MIMRRKMLLLAVACTAAIAAITSCKTASPSHKGGPLNVEPAVAENAKAEPAKTAHVTAILGAFKAEITLLQDELTDRQEHNIEGLFLYYVNSR